MTPERWQRLSAIYHAANACPTEERVALLRDLCAGDDVLRQEVEDLLAEGAIDEGRLLRVPLDGLVTPADAGVQPPLTGQKLGAYTVKELLGKGGMGEVYRAHDTQLGRDVALKILPPIFTTDADRLARFEREARILASLSHPNIAVIHGLERRDGIHALVLELVEGPTLADRIASGKMAVSEALDTARQIAEALDAAHQRGIVHRDLKPANVKLTSTGLVKVLDFGLAKTIVAADAVATRSKVAAGHTRAGTLLGTVPYMSPEQARGQVVDKRADIWAFGCVLYEMLTGRPAFTGESATDVLAAVVEKTPDWLALPASLSPAVTRVLQRCLEKDVRRRLRDIGEASLVLEDALSPATPAAVAVPNLRLRKWRVVAAVVSVVAGTVIWNLNPSSGPTSPSITRLAIPVSPNQPPAALRGLTLSPDGRYLAYVADQTGRDRLAVRAMDASETQVLPDTEGAAYPFFSPDGKWIGFFAAGKLKRVPLNGGTVVIVLDLSSVGGGGGGVWPSDDTIFFGADSGIWRISSAGGSPEQVTAVDRSKGEISHRLPLLLPNGQTLLYTLRYGPGWDEQQIVAQRLGTAERQVVIRGAATARYASTGHLIYTRAGTMLAVRFDPSRLEVSGVPVILEENIREGVPYADYDVSSDGTLAYVQQKPEAYNRLPVIVDRKGLAQPLPGVAPARYQNPRFSPDGHQVALETTGSISDVWIYDFTRATLTRLTTEGSSQFPVWSSDGQRITYRATRSGSRNLFWKSLDGTAAEERLTMGDRDQIAWSWSRDGTTLFFGETSRETRSDIWMLELGVGRTTRPFLREPFNEVQPRLSPVGHWLAYVSDRSGRPEVYIQSYPDSLMRWQISTDGGREPIWARDGRELFYRNDDKVMSVEIAEGAIFKASPPRLLFAGNYVRDENNIGMDVDPDGRRFLMIQSSNQEPPVTHINMVLNWFEELKRRLPVSR